MADGRELRGDGRDDADWERRAETGGGCNGSVERPMADVQDRAGVYSPTALRASREAIAEDESGEVSRLAA
jgi:hypothetical protein